MNWIYRLNILLKIRKEIDIFSRIYRYYVNSMNDRYFHLFGNIELSKFIKILSYIYYEDIVLSIAKFTLE